MKVTPGSTDVTTYFVLRLAADGTEATGLTITNIDLQYVRSGETPAAKVDASALAATNSAHADNSAIEIDSTDQPGLYRVDWPDAAFAAGVREVILSVKCATVFTEHLRVELETLQTGDSFARLGAPAGASVSADIADIEGKVDDLETRLGTPSDLGSGATVAANLVDIEGQTDNLPAIETKIDTIDDFLDTEVAAILADTNELQTDWANGGRLDNILDARASQASVDTIDDFLDTEIAAIKAKTDQLTFTVANTLDANVEAINGDADGATNLDRSTRAIVLGTVDAGATTTSIPTSALDPAASVADQFKGRIVIFDKDTTTAALRGQATDITANTNVGVLTVTALTTAPASGDTFTIT